MASEPPVKEPQGFIWVTPRARARARARASAQGKVETLPVLAHDGTGECLYRCLQLGTAEGVGGEHCG